ncbi:MAG TPA: PLP-dependent aminotransferase family protein [Casimicrobiaceae bacterium]|nr:PLP-dependent aminotransferase family protein [Casimicrobiaceae bacterium]
MDPIIGLDLALDLPRRGSRRLGAELHRQLRAGIVEGRLQAGLRLPSTRELAAALGVSRNTVMTAYDLLLAEGYVRTAGRGGTRVASVLSTSRASPPAAAGSFDRRLNPAWRAPYRLIPIAPTHDLPYDFTVGMPDSTLFPYPLWRRLSARALRAAARAPAAYAQPEGLRALREAIAGHVSFARAIACGPDEIVVTAGAQQAFDLLSRILVTPGKTTVAIEQPGYPPLTNVLAAAGAKIVGVPVDEEGLRVDHLPVATKLVFVTPSHQFPLGVHLSLARRRALLDFARARGAVIVEDDYDGEFRYGGKPLDALQTLDREACVFYVGTFSKSLFPALRLGFVIAPAWARPALVAAKQTADWHAPAAAQHTLAAFIGEGHLARHVRKVRSVYGERRAILQAALERFGAGRFRPIGIGAGLHLAAYLDRSLSASRLAEQARKAGFVLDPVARPGERRGDAIAFGYGAIPTERIAEAIRKLAALAREG